MSKKLTLPAADGPDTLHLDVSEAQNCASREHVSLAVRYIYVYDPNECLRRRWIHLEANTK